MDPSYDGSGQNTDPINRDYVIRIRPECDLNETSMMDKALDNAQRWQTSQFLTKLILNINKIRFKSIFLEENILIIFDLPKAIWF